MADLYSSILAGNVSGVEDITPKAMEGVTANSMNFSELVANTMMARSELINRFIDPRRDVSSECGYKANLQVEDFQQLYDREPIAARVVQVLPKESWQTQPTVFEDEDTENITPFEEAWDAVGKSLRGQSWYGDEESSPVWDYLQRLDELCGIGHFGVLLIGIDDGKQLDEPVEGINPTTGAVEGKRLERKVIYLRPFSEPHATVLEHEKDPTSPRYMQPVYYNLEFTTPTGTNSSVVESVTKKVHWTRVIHVADNLQSSEIFGNPRMKTVFNRVWDLYKLYGGSAEMYWRGGFPGLSIETNPALGGDVRLSPEKIAQLRSETFNYMNTLQRYLVLTGMTAKTLAPTVSDPTPQINAHIEALCIYIGCPKRIFMGSERGELSSSQDDSTWNDRLGQRQRMFITPRIIVPFVDRLLAMGVLPEPAEGYHVQWPLLGALNETEKVTLAVQRVDACSKYVGGQVETIMTPLDFYVHMLDMDEELAQTIVDNATKAMEEKQLEEQVQQQEAIDAGIDPNTGLPLEQQPANTPAPAANLFSRGTSGPS